MGKCSKKTVKYSGQALAIAMVMLVVTAIIGISVYSRSLKDKNLVLEERASAEALEVSDVMINILTQFPLDQVISGIKSTYLNDGEFDPTVGVTLTENINDGKTEITDLLVNLGSLNLGEGGIGARVEPLCPVDKGENEYQITLKEVDGDTYYEVKPGHVWGLPVRNLISQSPDCVLNIKLNIRGDSRVGFLVSRLYCDYDDLGNVTNCENYSYNDWESYCFSSTASNGCNNENFLESGWKLYSPEEFISIEKDVDRNKFPSEVRIKAIGGTIGISYSFSGDQECMTGLRMYQLRATANCSGVYRGKEILIPEAKWHNSFFDYVLFNARGSM